MTDEHGAKVGPDRARLSKVFDLVSPRFTRPDASWKDPIYATVTVRAVLEAGELAVTDPLKEPGTSEYKLAAAGLAIAVLVEAVEFFTATPAKIRVLSGERLGVRAAGYHLGPAGDH